MHVATLCRNCGAAIVPSSGRLWRTVGAYLYPRYTCGTQQPLHEPAEPRIVVEYHSMPALYGAIREDDVGEINAPQGLGKTPSAAVAELIEHEEWR